MIETDDFEKRLERFCDRNQVEISDAFLQTLLTLDEEKKTAPKPRRRFVLPVAALVALALGLGGWAILHTSRPAQTAPPAVTLEEPVSEAADHPAIQSEIGSTEKKEPAKQQTPVPPKPEPAVSPTKPGQSGTALPEFEDPAPAQPDAADPASPDIPQQAEPGGPTSGREDSAAPVEPEDTAPVKPDAPDPPVSDEAEPPVVPPAEDPAVEPPEDPPVDPQTEDPPVETPDDPPAVVKLESPFSAEFHREGDRDMVTLTLLSTGECVEVDVTGWEASSGQAVPAGEHSDDPQTPQDELVGAWIAVAFHQPVHIQITSDGNGTVHAEAYYLSDYLAYITQSIPGKENEDET